MILNLVLDFVFESLQFNQSFLGEIFGRRLVLLDTLEVLDSVLSFDLLFIDDVLELLVLSVDFLEDFFLEAFLPHDS